MPATFLFDKIYRKNRVNKKTIKYYEKTKIQKLV